MEQELYQPKQKSGVFMLNPKNYATWTWNNSKVVWLLGRSSCSSPSAKGSIDTLKPYILVHPKWIISYLEPSSLVYILPQLQTAQILTQLTDSKIHGYIVYWGGTFGSFLISVFWFDWSLHCQEDGFESRSKLQTWLTGWQDGLFGGEFKLKAFANLPLRWRWVVLLK